MLRNGRSRWGLFLFTLTLSVFLGGCSQGEASWDLNASRSEEISRLPFYEFNGSTPIVARPDMVNDAPTRSWRPRTAGPIEWAAANPRNWKYIVIHHSATTGGSAQLFDRQHRQRGWDELGYHFVITNGDGGPDGRVQIGSRWTKQKHGAHCGGTPDNEYNEVGIGVCLVGNFQTHMPTAAQTASLNRLVKYLADTYNIPPHRIIAHRDAPGAQTACCGKKLWAYLHNTLQDSVQPSVAKK